MTGHNFFFIISQKKSICPKKLKKSELLLLTPASSIEILPISRDKILFLSILTFTTGGVFF